MKSSVNRLVQRLVLSGGFTLSVAFSALAQGAPPAKLQLDLSKLGPKASESVTVSLDGAMLQLAGKFLDTHDPEEAKVKDLIAALKGVYVRSYTFEGRSEYSDADLEPIRAQLRAPGWSKIVDVKSRHDDNVEVHTLVENGTIAGLAVISAEPRELTVINIVGPIDLEKLASLEGHLGIPKFRPRGSKSRWEE